MTVAPPVHLFIFSTSRRRDTGHPNEADTYWREASLHPVRAHQDLYTTLLLLPLSPFPHRTAHTRVGTSDKSPVFICYNIIPVFKTPKKLWHGRFTPPLSGRFIRSNRDMYSITRDKSWRLCFGVSLITHVHPDSSEREVASQSNKACIFKRCCSRWHPPLCLYCEIQSRNILQSKGANTKSMSSGCCGSPWGPYHSHTCRDPSIPGCRPGPGGTALFDCHTRSSLNVGLATSCSSGTGCSPLVLTCRRRTDTILPRRGEPITHPHRILKWFKPRIQCASSRSST